MREDGKATYDGTLKPFHTLPCSRGNNLAMTANHVMSLSSAVDLELRVELRVDNRPSYAIRVINSTATVTHLSQLEQTINSVSLKQGSEYCHSFAVCNRHLVTCNNAQSFVKLVKVDTPSLVLVPLLRPTLDMYEKMGHYSEQTGGFNSQKRRFITSREQNRRRVASTLDIRLECDSYLNIRSS